LSGNVVGFRLALEYLLATGVDVVAAAQQSAHPNDQCPRLVRMDIASKRRMNSINPAWLL
jgi:hypothetical protein